MKLLSSVLFFLVFGVSEVAALRQCRTHLRWPNVNVSLNSFLGKWYQVVRTPIKRERLQRCGLLDFSAVQTPSGSGIKLFYPPPPTPFPPNP